VVGVAVKAVVEGLQADAQGGGGGRFVAALLRRRGEDELPLGIGETRADGRSGISAGDQFGNMENIL
jgi:hypothetical protein